MKAVEVGGVRIVYDQVGRGPAVVFSHAGIADRRMWKHQVERFSATHRVITYDWRGYGESGEAEGSFAPYRDLLGLMDALDVEEATLVGSSMGGSYSLEVALAEPSRVTGLALICSGLSGHVWPEEMNEYVKAHVRSSVPAERLARYRGGRNEYVDPAEVDAMARAQAEFIVAGPKRPSSAVDPQVWELALTMLRGVFERSWRGPVITELTLDPPPVERLAEIQVPTVVINGLEDPPWVQAVSDLISDRIPGARRIDLADTGHLPPLERPDQINQILQDLLRQ
ncbi:alpha/beta hydrolase [Kribbella pittospori]|uniref:Alpha/beta hydrolase n=1 Tax=Kribbella pittospori TaxID=722689 RepID=A0A4R0KI06_9ACTN|nr:alpha/beta hydrolase [Kribbella pittospori]TCC57588.1 alpha/beta hydrolase [Kribbella pittospori]